MGKATEISNRLASEPLTAAEIRARRTANELRNGNVIAMPDGTLRRKGFPSEAPQVVQVAPRATWD
jgi:hypothetical protein